MNPGSATGAYSGLEPYVVWSISDSGRNTIASFVLMDIQESKLRLYVYSLYPEASGEKVKIQQLSYKKKEEQ